MVGGACCICIASLAFGYIAVHEMNMLLMMCLRCDDAGFYTSYLVLLLRADMLWTQRRCVCNPLLSFYDL